MSDFGEFNIPGCVHKELCCLMEMPYLIKFSWNAQKGAANPVVSMTFYGQTVVRTSQAASTPWWAVFFLFLGQCIGYLLLLFAIETKIYRIRVSQKDIFLFENKNVADELLLNEHGLHPLKTTEPMYQCSHSGFFFTFISHCKYCLDHQHINTYRMNFKDFPDGFVTGVVVNDFDPKT